MQQKRSLEQHQLRWRWPAKYCFQFSLPKCLWQTHLVGENQGKFYFVRHFRISTLGQCKCRRYASSGRREQTQSRHGYSPVVKVCVRFRIRCRSWGTYYIWSRPYYRVRGNRMNRDFPLLIIFLNFILHVRMTILHYLGIGTTMFNPKPENQSLDSRWSKRETAPRSIK
jgi:hypothetical protein